MVFVNRFNRHKRIVFGLLFSLLLMCTTLFNTVSVSAADPVYSVASEFTYTGGAQYYTVPSSGWYQVEVYGAQGGDSIHSGQGSHYGGKGGHVSLKWYFTEGTQLQINVGSAGTNSLLTGGVGCNYGGGGSTSSAYFAAGGGMTEIYAGSTRLVAAGGGGGASLYQNGKAGGATGSGNTSSSNGSNGGAGYAGGGAGWKGGMPGSSSSQAVGGSNGWVASYGGNASVVLANDAGVRSGNGYVIVTRISNYSVTVRLNGGSIDGDNSDLSYGFSGSSDIYRFGYTGTTQVWTCPRDGYYRLTVAGASGGGNASGSSAAGYGGKSVGTVYLTQGTVLYVNVGGAGWQGYSSAGGWNGGGSSGAYETGASGGGGTDISLYWSGGTTAWNNHEHLWSRIIVAGGGGGADNTELGSAYAHDDGTGGAGGGSTGGYPRADGSTCYYVAPGGQSSAGGNGGFGYGGPVESYNVDAGAGGGGWFGGCASGYGYTYGGSCPYSLHNCGGAGGSGYLFTSSSWKPSGYLLGSSYYLTDTSMTAGCNYGHGSAMIEGLGIYQNIAIPSRDGYRFDGYSVVSGSGSIANGSSYSTFTYAEGETVVKANWTKIGAILTVNPNGGVWNDSEDIQYISKSNGTVYSVSNPTRYGYDFTGWTFNGGGSWNASSHSYTFSTVDGTLTANWSIHKSSLVVDPNSGVYNETTSTTTYFNKTFGSTQYIANPTKTGYQFVRWEEQNGSDGYVDGDKYWHFATVDGRIKAIWEANTYSVVYHMNKPSNASHDVVGSQATQTCRYDSNYNFNSNSETSAGSVGYRLIGWHFTGWNTKADGSGTRYSAGQAFSNLTTTQYGTIDLYAQWAQNTCTISYDSNTGYTKSGANAASTTVFKYEDSTLNLIDVSTLFAKTGYHTESATAWLYNSASGTKYPEIATTSGTYLNPIKNTIENSKSSTLKMYVNWIENTYNIVYEKNTPARASSAVVGTTASQNNLLWTHDYVLSANGYSLTGWTFKGWSLSPTDYVAMTPGNVATVQYYNKQTINNKNDTKLSDDDKVTIKLYAIWAENHYTIVFDGNNDTGYVTGSTPSMVKILYESVLPLSTNGFHRTSPVNMEYKDGLWRSIDSVFLGWNYSVSNGQSVSYLDNQNIVRLSATDNSTVTLYAVWDDNPTFNMGAEFPDRYFTVSDAQSGAITSSELLSTVTAYDREGIQSIELVGYDASDYTSVSSPCIMSQTYKVTDTYGRFSYVTINVHILENEQITPDTERNVRQYDDIYYKDDGVFVSVEDGGLVSTSRWLTDDAYNAILEYAVLSRGDANNTIYSFSGADLTDIKDFRLTGNVDLGLAFNNYVSSHKK